MRWPDIFFKAKPGAQSGKPAVPTAPKDKEPETPPAADESTAQRLPVFKVTLPPSPPGDLPSDNEVLKDMAEADTLREMSRTSGIRLVRRDFFTGAPTTPGATPPAGTPAPSGDNPFQAATPPPSTIIPAPEAGPPRPAAVTINATPAPGTGTPPPGVPPVRTRTSPSINLSTGRILPTVGAHPSAMTIVRRRMKMNDVARIVLPPRRDDSTPKPEPTQPTAPGQPTPHTAGPAPVQSAAPAAIIPPSFSVPVTAGTILQNQPAEKPVTEKPTETSAPDDTHSQKIVEAIAIEQPSAVSFEPTSVESPASAQPAAPAQPAETSAVVTPEVIPPSAETPAPSTPEPAPTAPASEPAATTFEPSPVASPTTDPASAVPPTTAGPAPSMPLGRPREKREFVLSNGERIIGCILSETPDAIYLDHNTLGVLTIPRSQIALRPVEIILINGDRIVGDIIAETAESLFVKHASLGILTIPRNQRSNRVVEAILTDGDRILGEVLGETENFTVIRSATLGTVAVPHNRVAMLNRRAEQVEMKSLPPPSNPSPS